MNKNVTQRLIENHLVEGRMQAGEEIGLKIDQTLTQDATGTLVMLELEAMDLRRVRTEISAQESAIGSYRAPLANVTVSLLPPQTTIRLPVQTAV